MSLRNILRDIMEQEILTSVKERDICMDMSLSKIQEVISQVISERRDPFDIPTKRSKVSKVEDPNRCCARIWDENRGTRCKPRVKDGDYCGKHLSEIERKGYIKFKRYDEERPVINEKGNDIPWYEDEPMEVLEIIINYQLMNLKTLIKRTNITP